MSDGKEDIKKLNGEKILPQGGQVKNIVILLHGYGADGRDLIDIGRMLAPAFPDTAFFSPNAPYRCEMSPMGYQWFSLAYHDLNILRDEIPDDNPSYKQIMKEVKETAPILNNYIDELLEEYNLSEENLAVIAFSQGTMMSLYTLLRREKEVAAIVGFSGAILGAETLPQEIKSKPPVILSHGTADPVVPFGAMEVAEKHLKKNGIKVSSYPVQGMQHGIAQESIMLAAKFLQDKLINNDN